MSAALADDHPDVSRCPVCGATELEVRSDEHLSATNSRTLTVAAGLLVGAVFGLTEPRWDDCQTVAYVACCCDEALPEADQVALDAALGNKRLEK